jgi:nucleotide-binding universal stress UspA family protein
MTAAGSPSPLRSIVVGVDGSPGADRALGWAIARAQENGARLVLAHVLTYSAELRRDAGLETMTTWRRALRRRLDDVWAKPAILAGVDVRCELLEDETAAAGLLKLADAAPVDLIVLGAHGRGSLADRLLGATTYRVSHAAHAPVVIVPPDWRPVAA